MRRRQIIVPLTEEAVLNLEQDSVNEIDQIIYNIGEKDFMFLFNNIFHRINELYPEIIIDDFEEEQINDTDKIKEIVKLLQNLYIDSLLINRLINMFMEAVHAKTGIYFFF